MKISLIAMVISVVSLTIKKQNAELTIVLGLGCCLLILFLFVKVLDPVLDYLKKLFSLSKLDPALTEPLLKSVAIGILTQFSGSICNDAGQGSMSKLIELCGSVLCLYLSLPILNSVLKLFQDMGAGG